MVEVKNTTKGPKILVSRTHPELVKRLFESEVTEVKDGIVEIKSIAREAGSRTKIAVWSNDPDVDPVGACVGMNGQRGQRHRERIARREDRHHQLEATIRPFSSKMR